MPEKAPSAVPQGLRSLTPQLWFNGHCADALDFYERAFGAQLVGNVARGPEDLGVMHAMLRIGDSCFMLADAMPGGPEYGPEDTVSSGLWLYGEDCDSTFSRAATAGAEVVQPLQDMFWGDRMGKLRDPFGHLWTIATCRYLVGEAELKKGMDEWVEAMKQEV
ncbi:MAG TPA: VOC family protein [bacterium]|nr:VOC family protein [bacterium]HXB96887.1 VOC family protein [bacterium]